MRESLSILLFPHGRLNSVVPAADLGGKHRPLHYTTCTAETTKLHISRSLSEDGGVHACGQPATATLTGRSLLLSRWVVARGQSCC